MASLCGSVHENENARLILLSWESRRGGVPYSTPAMVAGQIDGVPVFRARPERPALAWLLAGVARHILRNLADRFTDRLEIASGMAFEPGRKLPGNLRGFFLQNLGHLVPKGGEERLHIVLSRFFEVLIEFHQGFVGFSGMRSGIFFQIFLGLCQTFV